MGKFIDQNLASGEKVAYETSLHWMVFGTALFFGIMSAPCLAGALYIHVHEIQMGMGGDIGLIFLLIFGGLFFLVAFFSGLSALIAMKTTEYAATNKRVVFKSGLFNRRVVETQLGKIESFTVSQGLLGRLFDYGTVALTGTGGLDEEFDYIRKPFEFKKMVQGQTA